MTDKEYEDFLKSYWAAREGVLEYRDREGLSVTPRGEVVSVYRGEDGPLDI